MTGSLSKQRAMYIFDVDFGGTAQSVALTADVTLTAGGRLELELFDLDGAATLATPVRQSAPDFASDSTSTTTGNAVASINTRSYSGVHQFLLILFDGDLDADYDGTVSGAREPDGVEVEENEWWIKVSRAVGGTEGAYDFPPHVVRVRTAGVVTHVETLDGKLRLHDSPWDPYTSLLPVTGGATAELVTTRHTAREITLDEPLDPDAFWAHVDTIGGSRWPGSRGGPRS